MWLLYCTTFKQDKFLHNSDTTKISFFIHVYGTELSPNNFSLVRRIYYFTTTELRLTEVHY